ncbi:MAG TPA: FtsK/SpoIIIE domain-containing protein [Roseimicrobium sp.]|nr:FtsK/SpoIIIE domain-containing protein [Roseimicrobium sp.]
MKPHPKHPGAGNLFQLLARLRDELRRTTSQNQAADTEWRARLAQEHRRFGQVRDVIERELEAFTSAADEAAANRRLALNDWYAARQERIRGAARSGRERRFHEIESNESRRKFEIQRDRLQAERTRDNEVASAELSFAEGQAGLGQTDAAITALAQEMEVIFGAQPPGTAESVAPVLPADDTSALTELQQNIGSLTQEFRRFRRRALPALFRALPLPGALVLLAGVHGLALFLPKMISQPPFPPEILAGSWIGTGILATLLNHLAKKSTKPAAASLNRTLATVRRMQEAARAQIAAHHGQNLADAADHFTKTTDDLNRQWDENIESSASARLAAQDEFNHRSTEALLTLQHHFDARCTRVENEMESALREERHQIEARLDTVQKSNAGLEAAIQQDHVKRLESIAWDWRRTADQIQSVFDSSRRDAAEHYPAWDSLALSEAEPSSIFPHNVPFGSVAVDVEKLAGMPLPQEPLDWRGAARFEVPLLLEFPDQGSLLLETGKHGRDAALSTINATLLRLLTAAPPGKVNFTLIDPVGLGQSFPGITHLADYGEQLISGRIWTQPPQIEQRLAELNEHMEKVIQMYLRNDFATIVEYNEQAGTIAEKFHFVVVADFPSGFTEAAAKRLLSIASSGARCGVFTLIHWDQRLASPAENISDDLRKSSIRLENKSGTFLPVAPALDGISLALDTPPGATRMTALIEKIGTVSQRANRIEVPFSQITPAAEARWSLKSTSELRVPIGRTGATKLQQLALGQGTRQHGLIAGKTGSGKSTLFHVIITNLALWYSPSEVEFYLVDFKKGVEFQCYATNRLPHAKVIAIESDREFGLSVLQRLDEELRRRGELFRKAGAQDLPGYARAGIGEPLPRTLLLIDEFQEFFVEDDRIAQGAALLLDRIVRQGRAFGIHVLLGSQTLGGAYTLARATLGQMVVRIALQCNEADALLIMDDSNPAPRLLTRPGEGIYNDAAGAVEGNSPFQTVWLSDEIRDQQLKIVTGLASRGAVPPAQPIVFDGNAPGDIRDNTHLEALLKSPPDTSPTQSRIWLGAPNSIKGPTEIVLSRQSGSHVLFVGQRDEMIHTLLHFSILALAAQHPAGGVRFIVIDGSAPDSAERGQFNRLATSLPHDIRIARGAEIDATFTELAAELKRRTEDPAAGAAPSVFLLINGLQRFKRFRFEEDFGFGGGSDEPAVQPGRVLNDLICEGAPLGIHLIAVCDTYGNLTRFLSRKAITEFSRRVLFQMSATDSASLIDTPKASTLGLHRALLHNEQEGQLELFRPYAEPEAGWLDEAVRRIARR